MAPDAIEAAMVIASVEAARTMSPKGLQALAVVLEELRRMRKAEAARERGNSQETAT